jgi:hypothetical protein
MRDADVTELHPTIPLLFPPILFKPISGSNGEADTPRDPRSGRKYKTVSDALLLLTGAVPLPQVLPRMRP